MKRLFLLPVLMLGLSFAQDAVDDLDIIISRSMTMTGFCGSKTSICSINSLDRDRYHGMSGRLTSSDPVHSEFGKNIFEIKMSDGSFLYYSTREDSPFIDRYGPDKLSNHNKKLSRIGTSIIEGGAVVVNDVFLDERGIGYKYKLSTGNEIFGDYLSVLEKILPVVPASSEIEFVRMTDDLSLKYDDMEDVFFISISPVALFVDSSAKSLPIRPYVVLRDGKPQLRIVFYYSGSDWLFANRVLVKVDDQRVNFDRLSFNKDNSGYSVWEWHDKKATEEEIKLLSEIANGKDVNVRFYGEQNHRDRAIEGRDKELIQNIINIYEIFK